MQWPAEGREARLDNPLWNSFSRVISLYIFSLPAFAQGTVLSCFKIILVETSSVVNALCGVDPWSLYCGGIGPWSVCSCDTATECVVILLVNLPPVDMHWLCKTTLYRLELFKQTSFKVYVVVGSFEVVLPFCCCCYVFPSAFRARLTRGDIKGSDDLDAEKAKESDAPSPSTSGDSAKSATRKGATTAVGRNV